MKVTLTTLTSRYGSIDALNSNFEELANAIENTLSRDGTGPNALEADVDANSYRIINLPTPVANSDAATKKYVDDTTSLVTGYLDEIRIVAANIEDVNTVADNIDAITSVQEDFALVADKLTEVAAVADNMGSVELVGLDLNGAFQQGVIYDFGAITEDPVGPASESTSSITIVATNIADIQTVATNIDELLLVDDNAAAAAASAAAALVSENNAADSETNAGLSEAAALVSANNAHTSELAAEASADSAVASATAASLSEAAALSYSNTAVDAKDDAVVAQLAAEAALASTLAAYDNFDDRYLGAKASDPTTDNDGDPLIGGALYFQTGAGMKIWTGSTWEFAYVPGATYLAKANNLSDLTNAATARTNLGLAAIAATGSYNDLSDLPTLGALADLDEVGTTEITNNAVTVEKLAATLDYGSIV